MKHQVKFSLVAASLAGLLVVSQGAAPATPAAITPAATPAPPPRDFSNVQIRVTKVAGNLYMLEGEGGNVSVLDGPDGALLIDSQFAPLTDKLVAAIRTFSQAPLRFLVNTHVHGDHTGGNANFVKYGATVIAHENVRQRMRFPAPTPNGQPGTPAVAAALPVITFQGPTGLHINGHDVSLSPLPPGHTDGDILIEIPSLDVLIVGDFFRTVGYPTADRNNGGSFRGIVSEIGITLGKAGVLTRVVPGHGVITDRNGLLAQRDLLVAMIAKVEPMVRQGMTVEQVLATKPTAEYDARVVQGAQGSERFVRGLYAELSAEQR